jgi:hypothetical protein
MRYLSIYTVAMVFSLLLPLAQAANPLIELSTRNDTVLQLARAPCLVQPAAPAGGSVTLKTEGGMDIATFVPTPGQRQPVEFDLAYGNTKADPCVVAGTLHFKISTDDQPQITPDALQKAFVTLMGAFILALLLESAFELLFNWRLFQELFAGRAWRTPVMFAVSLLLVRQFNLDLLSAVFAAYHGDARPPQTSWLTSCLSAMIISGGSVGVNRLLVTLGFRSALPKAEALVPKLNQNEAYVSIEVRAAGPQGRYRIDMLEVDPAPAQAPTLAVVTIPKRVRLRDIFFPSHARVPRTGGKRVTALTKAYRITVTDLETQLVYDANGNKLGASAAATDYRFAPQAIIDFIIQIG